MPINSNFYVHELDKTALDALKAIPGFTPLLKAFLKVWSEKQFYIQNMSTNLRISDKQLSKYYDMLLPICEKLGIDVPELYLEFNVVPNAYTSGDTKPFIVMTSGLLETMPEYLIPTVLAHECGHIACHHVLYTTMGQLLLSEARSFLGLNDLAAFPIQVAFYYWMRCSELSADRAAAICDGSSEKVVEMCMRFAGYNKHIDAPANVEEFMNQAIEYKEMMDTSKWNKTLEFIMFHQQTHPLNAVRAYECNEWTKQKIFLKINEYLSYSSANTEEKSLGEYLGELPMDNSSRYYIGQNYQEVQTQLNSYGFTNIDLIRVTTKNLMTKDGQVIDITINKQEKFEKGEWYPADTNIAITYYEAETKEEVAAAHPGQLRVPESSKRCVGKNYKEVIAKFNDAGFSVIVTEEQTKAKKDWMAKEGTIVRISINGQTQFDKGEWFDKNALIRIVYLVLPSPEK